MGYVMEDNNAWVEYLRTENKIIQRIAVGLLDHGPFCNPRQRPPSMHRHDDEIKNDQLMSFSPRPILYNEKSHPLWGFRGDAIAADRTGIFPLKWLTRSLRERRMGYIPPTLEAYALTDYDSLVFAMSRTLAGKCVTKCHWLLEHDCHQGLCTFPPFHKGPCLCDPCKTHLRYRTSQNVARSDGNTLLDEFHDAVSCNEKWRNK